MLRVYSDGGSRGNPGPAAIAFIIDEDGEIVKRHHCFIGIRTNNQAEYEALVSALECALEFGSGVASCFLDSELVVKQLNGEYKVKDFRLRNLWLKAKELQRKFDKVSFTHVSRTDRCMQEADSMVNDALDHATRAEP